MKTSKLIVAFLAIFSSLLSAIAQGGFQNLGFESARIVPIPGDPNGRVDFAAAFPGWTGFAGTNQITAIFYNDIPLAAASISLLGTDGPAANSIIAGRYTPFIHAGGYSGSFVDASIAQVGMLPVNAVFLDFKANVGGAVAVTFAGQNISLSPIGSGPNYTLYGGDVTAFAGQVGELRFTAATLPSNPYNSFLLDSISFSSIPEPSVLALAILGAGAFGVGLWRRRRRGLASGRTRRSD